MGLIGYDAARVSDEHGKGSEILRQQVVSFARNVADLQVVMVAEVDGIVRYVKVSRGTALTDGDVVLSKRRGSTVVNMTASTDVTGAINTVQDIALTDAKFRKGDILMAAISAKAPAPAQGISVHVGWVPDMWDLDANYRSYLAE